MKPGKTEIYTKYPLLWLFIYIFSSYISFYFKAASAIAKPNLETTTSQTLPAKPKPASDQTPSQNRPSKPNPKSTWEAIWSLFKGRKEPNLGSRSAFYCMISPGLLETVNIIWGDRPLFIWKGTPSTVELRVYYPFNPEEEEKILWQQFISPELGKSSIIQIPYQGQPLEPGKIYDWEIINHDANIRLRRSFQIMENTPKNAISKDLSTLEQDLRKAKKGLNDITVEKAYYFAQQELWSDMFYYLYSASHRSEEFSRKLDDSVQAVCGEWSNTESKKDEKHWYEWGFRN